jgi:cation transport regulator ChaB
MQWPVFLRGLPTELREALPADLRDFRWSAYSYQAKAWFGNADLHYEIWVRGRLRVVELGLHFEADDLTNARLLAAFRARAKEVKRGLGKDARIEEWDRGWARVWEPISLGLPDDELREGVATRLGDYVRVLEPIVRAELPSDVRWVLPAARRAAKATAAWAKPTRQAADRRTAGSRTTSSRGSR